MRIASLGAASLACLLAAGPGICGTPTPRSIDARSLIEANADSEEWLTHGRTYDEQRFSPLDRINTSNVQRLKLAWYADLDTARGQEATPLVIEGRIYLTTAWSMVKAYDARTGRLLWAFDPKVPGETAVRACCDVVNRGLAAWGHRLYLGTLDGRLIALDRDSGKPVWSRYTVERSKPYTITGAPRVIDGRVIIGNGGAEMGVRGYVAAYDAQDGHELWRFYTVPAKPGSNRLRYLKDAESSWNGDWWRYGGGGTVWDSMAYDPELDLLYIGVGNGDPWNQAYRSPGGGDNLYLSSIVAIRSRTGEYVWHYQMTPGDIWDYDATQHIVLADLPIGGQTRHVLMQAPKNGFFYVLDRRTGELISARNFVPVNWASGIDPKTGRPMQNEAARVDRTGKPFVVAPAPGGAHNWQPMAFDPRTGLVYIPAQIGGFPYVPDPHWERVTQGWNTGMDFAGAAMPADPAARAAAAAATRGQLIAWDPVSQSDRWHVDFKGPWNGGLLATGGGLVFQGNSASEFAAYDASTGAKLWSGATQTGIIAAPITYVLDGEQYVAVLAGWGGSWALLPGVLTEVGGPVRNVSRLLVFKLNGTAELPAAAPIVRKPIAPPAVSGSSEQLAEGAEVYGRFCSVCHGDAAYGSTLLPDLRRSSMLTDPKGWMHIVLDGALQNDGMVSFARVLNAQQVDAVRHYVIKRANEDQALGDR